ncbi:MAG TPA: urate hydroxylase PuuD [Beijerinckia sp.]|jgi:uncharacterized membrane protein|nr:urate hydroxylase PuuD [Beijerinckia sp.]
MAKILEKLNSAVLSGAVLVLLALILLHRNDLAGWAFWGPFFTFLHVLSGVVWIGLLYYFNLVQIPTMPKVPAELKPGVSKFIAPEALFWFRWGAASTVVTGLIVFFSGTAVSTPTIQIGMLLGLIMAFNVWFIIWPNQKKALGLVEADDATKAKSARIAMLTSRTNFVLSLPMLYCMVTARLVG